MSKYLKVLTNNETYDAWTNGGIPHVALKEDTDELFTKVTVHCCLVLH